MKIRTQFIISTVVLGILLLLVSISVIITNRRVENTHQQQLLAAQIERQAYELGYLANDYLLHRENQQASRWESKFASFSHDLSNMDVNTPEQQALLANIKTNQQRLKNVFAGVKAEIESAPQSQESGFREKFMQISWSRLEVQHQGMIFNASRLEEMLLKQEDQLRQLTSLLSFVLIGVLGAFLLGNYGLTLRRTLQAIAELQTGTRIIGSGNLDFAIAVKNEDEIGELSHAFNQMAANLKQVTASKVDLEKEIMERKRVEEQLEAERGNLQMMFNAVNVGMLLMDESGSTMQVNNVVAHWTGKKPSEIHGFQPGDVLGCIHVANDPGNCGRTPHCGACSIRNTFETVLRSGQPVHNVEAEATLLLNGDQVQFWLELSADPLMINGKQHAILALNDITARKQAEVELSRLASFPERNPNPVLELGYSGDVVYLNPKSRELFPDLASSGFRHPILAGLEGIISKFKEGQLEDVVTQETKVGNDYYHQTIVNIPESGRVRVYNLDITTRKQAEEALRRNEAFLLETGKMAKVGGWELNLQTMRPVWTLETYRIHEVDPSLQPELEGAIDFYAPEARSQISEAVRQAIEAGQPYDLELPLITAKGRHIWIRTIGQPEFHEGRCVRLFGAIQDITERKQAEGALLEAALQKQASEYARTLIEVSLDPLVTISSEGKITDVNEATIRATGLSRAELVGTDFSEYFTEPEKAEQGYRQVFAQGFVTDYPLTIRHCNGRLMDVLYNASLYRDANGNVLGVFAAARDVTAQKQAEAELKRHKDNLEILVKERTAKLEESSRELSRSNQNLEQFAYVASHDLQEPLRIMSSYSQLLERRYKDRLDQDANEFIDFIVEAAARMQKLITDLLAYSRAGHETIDKVEVDCNKVVHRLVTAMARTIESADGRVTFDSLPSIMAHESSLIQLFQNLIGNALKFRGEQPPCIHMSARQADGEWIFSVRDNGIGIEPQYCERIFMIFQRLHPRDKYPGTGIGLSICKKIVENLGGRIWVESEPGQGCNFSFTIPAREIETIKE